MEMEKYGDYRDQVEAEVHDELALFGFRLVHDHGGEPLEFGHMMLVFGWMQKSYSSYRLNAFLDDLCQVCKEQDILCIDLKTGEPLKLDRMKATVIVGAFGTAYWRGKYLRSLEEQTSE